METISSEEKVTFHQIDKLFQVYLLVFLLIFREIPQLSLNILCQMKFFIRILLLCYHTMTRYLQIVPSFRSEITCYILYRNTSLNTFNTYLLQQIYSVSQKYVRYMGVKNTFQVILRIITIQWYISVVVGGGAHYFHHF